LLKKKRGEGLIGFGNQSAGGVKKVGWKSGGEKKQWGGKGRKILKKRVITILECARKLWEPRKNGKGGGEKRKVEGGEQEKMVGEAKLPSHTEGNVKREPSEKRGGEN